MDEHGCPGPTLPPHPDGRRALVTGEYGGLGLAPDVRRLRAAQAALIDDASRATVAGCAQHRYRT